MTAIPNVSVIIPTLNEEKYLPVLLESLFKIDAPLEIIVVDGGSIDHTEKVVEAAKACVDDKKTLKFVALGQKGIALQRNIGASLASHELLLFCDADIVAPSTPKHQYLISEFVKNNYSIATGKLVPLEKTMSAVLLHMFAYRVQRMLAMSGKAYFGGAFILTTKSVFSNTGGFDEKLRISEDVDYSRRAAEYGSFMIFNIPIATSMRRYQKYGYGWLFKNPGAIMRLITKGRITNDDKLFYPFGEY